MMLPAYVLGLIGALGAWVLVAYLIEVQWGSHRSVFHPEIGAPGEDGPLTRLAPREFWGRLVPLLLTLIGGLLLLAIWGELRG